VLKPRRLSVEKVKGKIMDLTTAGGLIIGIGAVMASFLWEGGHLSAVIRPPALVLVIFGTIGAATATTSWRQLRSLPSFLRLAFFAREKSPTKFIERICEMASKARKEGLLSLEYDLMMTKDPFFRKALGLVIDGMEADKIREILETEMEAISERHEAGALFFQKMGGFSPTMGILGTVLGLIHALSNITDAPNMARHIASAFIATLWGVGLANLVYLPICDKLRNRFQEEMRALEIILEGVVALSRGENPRIIRTKLYSYLLQQPREERR